MIVKRFLGYSAPTTCFRHTGSDIAFLVNGRPLYERYDVMYKGETIGETTLRHGLFSVSSGLGKTYITTYIPASALAGANRNHFYSQLERDKYLEMAAVAYAQEARFNIPGIDDFVGADVWLLGKTEAPPLGPLFLGFDLSETTDFTVLALYWPETGRLDFRVYTVEKDIKMRAEKDNIPYDDLPAGQLHIAGKRIIDYCEVGADLKLLNYEHDVRGIACDPHKIKVLQDKMEEAGIDLANFPPFINISQTLVGMTGGLEEFERQMKEGHIKHNNSLLLKRSLSAAKVFVDGTPNRKFMKRQSSGRIDAAVAASMAIGLAHDRLSPKQDKDEWGRASESATQKEDHPSLASSKSPKASGIWVLEL